MTDTREAALRMALEALETAKNGLQWYQDSYPEAVNGCDDEGNEQIDAAISALTEALQVPAVLNDEHQQLMKFYGVDSLAVLVDAQARHIEKLQAKLPPPPSLAPNRVREG